MQRRRLLCSQSSLVNDAARVDSRVPNHHGILTPRRRSSAKSSEWNADEGRVRASEKGRATVSMAVTTETGLTGAASRLCLSFSGDPLARFECPFRRVSPIFSALSSPWSFSSLFRTNRHTLPPRDRLAIAGNAFSFASSLELTGRFSVLNFSPGASSSNEENDTGKGKRRCNAVV